MQDQLGSRALFKMDHNRPEAVTLTREELYEQVWTTPTTKLARTYGLSDVGLAKICKKHNIPKPPLGYWARMEHGYKVQRTPLPITEDEMLQVVRIHKQLQKRDGEEMDADTRAVPATENVREDPIRVADHLDSPHPVIERTLKSIKSAAADEHGILRPKAKQCLDVAVGRDSIERAMLVMDALVKAIEARGYDLSFADERNRQVTRVRVLDESIQFQLKESLKHRERQLTAAEKKERERWPGLYREHEYEYFPSGRLALCIIEAAGEGYRRIWSDGKKQKIEDCLGSFIRGLGVAAEGIKAARIRREQWEREWEEKQQRRQEEQERRWEEEKKIKELECMVASWDRSQKLCQFISVVEEEAIKKYGAIDPGSELGQWLSWARGYADSIDPIVRCFDKNQGSEREGE